MAVAMAVEVARAVALGTVGLMVVAVEVTRAVVVMTAAVEMAALAETLVGSDGSGGSVAEVGGGSGCEYKIDEFI